MAHKADWKNDFRRIQALAFGISNLPGFYLGLIFENFRGTMNLIVLKLIFLVVMIVGVVFAGLAPLKVSQNSVLFKLSAFQLLCSSFQKIFFKKYDFHYFYL